MVTPVTLRAGQPAPLFSLPDADMAPVQLAGFRGKKNVVLYFYPKDGTPACTLQATEFTDHEDEFTRLNCVVIGVSPDDCLSHAEFRDANGVSICLLADPEGEVSRKYGVWEERETHGQRKGCVLRSTFIIDRKGLLRQALYGVNPKGHTAEVLDLVRRIVKSDPGDKGPSPAVR
ncbi:MAG: peroxiredoxin [Burkholderiales bacterium]|nr:peroxiredoxin [Burkholderiales bacterium]